MAPVKDPIEEAEKEAERVYKICYERDKSAYFEEYGEKLSEGEYRLGYDAAMELSAGKLPVTAELRGALVVLLKTVLDYSE